LNRFNEIEERHKIKLFLGDFIFSTSYDRTARCWDFHTGASIRVFRGHNHGILPVIFLPSGHDAGELNDFESEVNIYTKDILVTGSQDTTAKTWSVETGECLKTFQGHIGAILCMKIDASGKILFTGSGDHTIRVWDVYRGNELRIYDQHQAAIINLLVTNKLLYSISADHTARCWVIDVGDCTRIYKGHHHSVSCIQIDNGLGMIILI
jgi:WD40 repeat protein